MITLDQLANLKLDDLVSRNRDKVSLSLITEDERNSLATGSLSGEPLDIIDDWRFVAYRYVDHPPAICLLGYARFRQTTRITSLVRVIDLENNLIKTLNSLYGLGTPGEGEPNLAQIFLYVTALRRDGLADILGLPQVHG